jgi:hypothetical protein
MIDWIKREYRRFRDSRTVKLAYAAKLLALIGAAMELMPAFRGMINPMVYPIIIAVLGVAGKHLRVATTTGIE